MKNTARRDLMKEITALSFVLDETALYLDSHPDDPAALAYYADMRAKYDDARAKYEGEYGALTHAGVRGGDRWSWVDGTWPWEREDD